MSSSLGPRAVFFPKADAAILSSTHGPLPTHPRTVGPIYDPCNAKKPIGPWPLDDVQAFYLPQPNAYSPTLIPARPTCPSDRYLRAFLAKNERLRLSTLWYYTRDILKEDEFLSGLQEKASLAQESTEWEFVVIGILDVNLYIGLATVGLPLATLPRGETICAHTVNQPPGSIFLLPNLMEDWRFHACPCVEYGGLQAYAGVPLRLQIESGDSVGLGSLCVASSTTQVPLTKSQQQTLARLADWVVADIVQCARSRRQRERRRMSELVSIARGEIDDAASEEPVLRILRTTYPDATISLQSSNTGHIEIEGRGPILLSDLEDGLWEDIDYLDDFIVNSNHRDLPSTRVVRILTAQCESISGLSFLVVASKDFRLVFDDVDSWFIQTCAGMLSQMWQKRLLAEAMRAKDSFLRGISHQLRTPIHGILGSVELLVEELKLRGLRDGVDRVSALLEVTSTVNSDGPSVYLDIIKTAGRDLISIVNSMITLDRWAEIAMTNRCYAVHTVTQLEAKFANEIRKAISGDPRYKASIFFKHDLPPDCDSVRTDINLLRDSLLPLVINAIQNTPEGMVVVATSIRPDCKELIVDVEDTGCGIHPDHHERIFEPYEKVGTHSTGAGLGLTLASKFATLLHGSVVLLSSDINRGSHFRATFREVECTFSNIPSQPLVLKLKEIPSKFYNLVSHSGGVSFGDYFTKFLIGEGFTPSDSIDDCFVMLDFVPDPEKRRMYLSQIPAGQVAICPVPASEWEARPEQTPNNVVYTNAPFLTSTIRSALEEADRLLPVIKASHECLLQQNERSLTLTKIDESPNTNEVPSTDESPNTNGGLRTDEGPGSILNLPSSKGQPLPPDNPGDPDLDAATSQTGPAAPVKSQVLVPIFPAIINSHRPKALLVDDNVINLRIMQMYCSKRRLPYCCATDGVQAVEMFSRHQSSFATGQGDSIQLILMDLQMPLCDGIEATREIRLLEKRNKWRESILFIVTGQDSTADRTSAEGAGANEFFVKPVGMKVLDRGVKQYFPAFTAS